MEHFAIFEMLPEGCENAISRRNLMTFWECRTAPCG